MTSNTKAKRLTIQDITVVEASLHDADLVTIMVSELLHESFFTPEPGEEDMIMDACNKIFEEESSTRVLLAFGPGRKPLGVMTISISAAIFAKGEFATIMEIYVSPNQRSLGIGQALMNYAKDMGARSGWKHIFVAVPAAQRRSRAAKFFARNGFRTHGPCLHCDLTGNTEQASL